jgi:hypothetical protein
MDILTWGRWSLNEKNLTLNIDVNESFSDVRELDLEDCHNAHSILKKIRHFSHKSWTTTEDIGDLVNALDQILGGSPGVPYLFGLDEKGDFATSKATVQAKLFENIEYLHQ